MILNEQPNSWEFIGIILTLVGSLATAVLATRTSLRVLKTQRADIKKNLCLELKKHFDSPDIFKSRYAAWQKLHNKELENIKTVSELFQCGKYDNDISIVFHFFESLGSYCSEGMIDLVLAKKFFYRTYKMWYDGLISKLTIDDKSKDYESWLNNLKYLEKIFFEENVIDKPEKWCSLKTLK